MSTQEHFDFSTKAIPDSWSAAAAEAPSGDNQAVTTQRPHSTPPPATSLDLYTACLAATATSLVAGFGWYMLQRNGLTTPWLAIALGAIIAVAIRVGGGREDVQTRGVLGLLFFIVTASVVIFLVARGSYLDLYGSSPGLTDFEQELLHSRLTQPSAIVAWFVGAFAAGWGAKLLR